MLAVEAEGVLPPPADEWDEAAAAARAYAAADYRPGPRSAARTRRRITRGEVEDSPGRDVGVVADDQRHGTSARGDHRIGPEYVQIPREPKLRDPAHDGSGERRAVEARGVAVAVPGDGQGRRVDGDYPGPDRARPARNHRSGQQDNRRNSPELGHGPPGKTSVQAQRIAAGIRIPGSHVSGMT
jgi:hypothetical protein